MALFPHLVEKLIQQAEARGDFKDLPGLGQPIPDLDAPYDEHWWVRKWMEREGLNPARELREECGTPGLAALFAEVQGDSGRGKRR